MRAIFYGIPALVGFVLGYFLTTLFVSVISFFVLLFAIVVRPKREQGLAAMHGIIVWIVTGISMVSMWVTHLYVTGADLGIPDLTQYIFRQ